VIGVDERALLKAVAKNLNDRAATAAYSDWLQDQGNAGWVVVANYPVDQWAIMTGGAVPSWWARHLNRQEGKARGSGYPTTWRLPWLEGEVTLPEWKEQPRHRTKAILTEYAEGRAK
jgi:uncharacterized protein (TIGR02996 family)